MHLLLLLTPAGYVTNIAQYSINAGPRIVQMYSNGITIFCRPVFIEPLVVGLRNVCTVLEASTRYILETLVSVS
jgi:hypothetical protein